MGEEKAGPWVMRRRWRLSMCQTVVVVVVARMGARRGRRVTRDKASRAEGQICEMRELGVAEGFRHSWPLGDIVGEFDGWIN